MVIKALLNMKERERSEQKMRQNQRNKSACWPGRSCKSDSDRKGIGTNLIAQICSGRKSNAAIQEETVLLPVHSGFQSVFLGSPKVLGWGKLASSTVASLTDNALALHIQIWAYHFGLLPPQHHHQVPQRPSSCLGPVKMGGADIGRVTYVKCLRAAFCLTCRFLLVCLSKNPVHAP